MDIIGKYFDLRSENEKLLEENNRLKAILFNQDQQLKVDTTLKGQYNLIPATVFKNSYSATNNYLTINRGSKDSIQEDLGVITSKGIVGIIDNTSRSYARVMSILNTNSSVSALLKNTDHFGELKWNTESPEIIQLVDIPKQAPIKAGDTIITSGRSTIFPKDIPVGKVMSFKLDETENFYIVDVQLFNDMTNIGHVHIIKNLDREEIKSVEQVDE